MRKFSSDYKMSDVDYWLWLSLKRKMTAAKMTRLFQIFNSPKEIFNLTRENLTAIKAIDNRTKAALLDKDISVVLEVKEQCRQNNISIMTYDSEYYPENLRHIPAPPYVLYIRCAKKINLNEYIRIAIVGNRRATQYGRTAAEKLSEDLVRNNFVIVSGMAEGIDAAAHRGAIAAGGITVAVMGCGLDRAYPSNHSELMQNIIETGMAISEYPPGVKPEKYHFPQRNRIISGICQGTLVVEAPKHSGSLITANYTIDYDRELFAVPGDITRERSEGTNNLLKEFAIPVTSARDIVEHFSFEYTEIAKIKKLQKEKGKIQPTEYIESGQQEKSKDELFAGLTEEEMRIITELSSEPMNFEVLTEKTGMPADRLTSLITMLEIKGKIKTHPGKHFTLNT